MGKKDDKGYVAIPRAEEPKTGWEIIKGYPELPFRRQGCWTGHSGGWQHQKCSEPKTGKVLLQGKGPWARWFRVGKETNPHPFRDLQAASGALLAIWRGRSPLQSPNSIPGNRKLNLNVIADVRPCTSSCLAESLAGLCVWQLMPNLDT